MRTIIAGSRNITDYELVRDVIQFAPWCPTVVLSGTARGVDMMGEWWANNKGIPVERYPADWEYFGKRAGPKRNEEMAKKADALIAVWDGLSRGTKHMIETAKAYGLRVHVVKV